MGQPVLVIDRRQRNLGGFEVGRVLAFAKRRMVGPFILLDHLGPVALPKGLAASADVRPHPHIGLATLTYLLDGEIVHRDSLAKEQAIRPGAVNWMVAGRGITHSERFEKARAEGGPMHAVQSWVALPAADEECEPAFAHHAAESLPVIDDRGVRARLLAGAAFGQRAKVDVRSPLFYLHCTLDAGATAEPPADYSERAAYVVNGEIECDGHTFPAGKMLVFDPGARPGLRAAKASTVLLLGGEPVGERFTEWNFVSSSKQRIAQAAADWRAGRMKLPDRDNKEFIPLPSAPADPNPMS
ncbi:MAG: pirin family protein [Stellaceae bacterium]